MQRKTTITALAACPSSDGMEVSATGSCGGVDSTMAPKSPEDVTLELSQVLPLFKEQGRNLLQLGEHAARLQSMDNRQSKTEEQIAEIYVMLRGKVGDEGLFAKVSAQRQLLQVLETRQIENHNRQMAWLKGLGIPLILLLAANLFKSFFG